MGLSEFSRNHNLKRRVSAGVMGLAAAGGALALGGCSAGNSTPEPTPSYTPSAEEVKNVAAANQVINGVVDKMCTEALKRYSAHTAVIQQLESGETELSDNVIYTTKAKNVVAVSFGDASDGPKMSRCKTATAMSVNMYGSAADLQNFKEGFDGIQSSNIGIVPSLRFKLGGSSDFVRNIHTSNDAHLAVFHGNKTPHTAIPFSPADIAPIAADNKIDQRTITDLQKTLNIMLDAADA